MCYSLGVNVCVCLLLVDVPETILSLQRLGSHLPDKRLGRAAASQVGRVEALG